VTRPGGLTAGAAVFGVCLAFWLLLSGHLTPLLLGLGVVSALVVTWLTRSLEAVSEALRVAPRFTLSYLPWLLKEIVVANLQVVRIILDPRLPIDPVLVRLRAPFRGELALTTLGNSITLTPGTVTLDVEGEELLVHALTRASAASLLDGAMAARVARACGDADPERAP
jgi:multicomponent Na+:H+ antiporter subunit E